MKKAILLGLTVVFAAVCVLLSGCGRSDEQISADVTPLVEDILKKQADIPDAKCERILDIVKDKDKKNAYTAKAMVRGSGLSNGQFVNLKIEYSDDMVFVTIVE